MQIINLYEYHPQIYIFLIPHPNYFHCFLILVLVSFQYDFWLLHIKILFFILWNLAYLVVYEKYLFFECDQSQLSFLMIYQNFLLWCLFYMTLSYFYLIYLTPFLLYFSISSFSMYNLRQIILNMNFPNFLLALDPFLLLFLLTFQSYLNSIVS